MISSTRPKYNEISIRFFSKYVLRIPAYQAVVSVGDSVHLFSCAYYSRLAVGVGTYLIFLPLALPQSSNLYG